MTESSNYDGVPPVPPAYGCGKRSAQTSSRRDTSSSPRSHPLVSRKSPVGGGMDADGHGVLTETITLSADGRFIDLDYPLGRLRHGRQTRSRRR
jgi:hypothetical protein